MVYFDNPPANPNTDAMFVYQGIKNMRYRLKEEWSGRDGYLGSATIFSPICIPVSAVAAAMLKGEKNALLTTAHLMKVEYDKQSSYGAIGPAVVKQLELIVAAINDGSSYVRNRLFFRDELIIVGV